MIKNSFGSILIVVLILLSHANTACRIEDDPASELELLEEALGKKLKSEVSLIRELQAFENRGLDSMIWARFGCEKEFVDDLIGMGLAPALCSSIWLGVPGPFPPGDAKKRFPRAWAPEVGTKSVCLEGRRFGCSTYDWNVKALWDGHTAYLFASTGPPKRPNLE